MNFRWQGLSLTSALRTHWVPREAPESGLWDPQFIPWTFLKDPSTFQACKKRSACKDSNRLNSTPLSPDLSKKKKEKKKMKRVRCWTFLKVLSQWQVRLRSELSTEIPPAYLQQR